MEKRRLLTVCMFVPIMAIYAQYGSQVNKKQWVLGLGVANYQGDDMGTKLTMVLPSVDLGMRVFVNENVALQGKISYAGLKGDDYKAGIMTGYSFKTQLAEASFNIEFYLMKENNKFDRFLSYKNHQKFNAYILLGLGANVFMPKTYSNNVEHNFAKEAYSKNSYMIPYGFGMKYKINRHMGMGINLNRRFTLTDFMDGREKDGTKTDSYMTGMVNLIYTIKTQRH